jgi:hypothetical protein
MHIRIDSQIDGIRQWFSYDYQTETSVKTIFCLSQR